MSEDDDSDSDSDINSSVNNRVNHGTVMDLEKREKRVLKLSFWAGVIFVILELFMAVYSQSQTLLMDMAIDGTELVVVAASLLLAPLLYKPINEKHPFGYAQCESVFIIVKGFMLVAVIVSLMVSSVQTMLNGGNHVDTALLAKFEFALSLLTFIFFLMLYRFSKTVDTPMINAEILTWRLDTFCSLGLAIAFLLPLLFQGTAFMRFVPYLDQVVSLVLAITVLPRTIQMIITAVRSVLLFAPDAEITDTIRNRVETVLQPYGYHIVFADITKTGRKIWASITFGTQEEKIPVKQVKELYRQLSKELTAEFEEIDLELIPDWES